MVSQGVPPALRRPEPVALTDKPVWSLADASKATTLSVRTLQKMIAAKTLPARKIGRRVLLDPQAVRAAIFGTSANPVA